MKHKISLFSLAILMITLLPARAVVVDLDTDIDIKYSSSYVWRGEVLNDEAVIQPSATIGAGNFSLNVWGTWDLTDVEDSSDYTRMDITLDYIHRSAKHMLRPGIISYIYYDDKGGDTKDTFELFVDYAFDVFLLPTLSVYYDFGEIEGVYATVSMAHGITLLKDGQKNSFMDMDLKVLVGAAAKNYTEVVFSREADTDKGTEAFVPDSSSLVDLVGKISFPITVSPRVTLTPEAKYSTLLDSDIVDALDALGEDTAEFIYSITFGMHF